MKINFNKPYFTGNETNYISDAVKTSKVSGNGKYTKLCQNFFEQHYGFSKCLLTSSCTDALEMASILIGIQPGDEVIVPSYTFVSTANAFVLRGAKIVFCDSKTDTPGIDENQIEKLITSKTKAIVPVHYAGIACDMDKIMEIAEKYNLFVIEDAAQAVDSYFTSKDGSIKPLGSIGHLAAFSFHETKNIISGEGGMLVINDTQFEKRAEIIWEKGTNRSAFFKGEVDKYGWVDIGSSFLPSDITAAFLFAQLENLDRIQTKRKNIWNRYYSNLKPLETIGELKLPVVPHFSSNNAHMFYICLKSMNQRTALIDFLAKNGIHAVFHYVSLNKSAYYLSQYDEVDSVNSDFYSDCLLRLPFYFELTNDEVDDITNCIQLFINSTK
jgi:dTDP-4-amino-4,6-dideoxygalactose transaminase